ncbi:MAG: tetratricopeptide repeat protein [Adhaeribacter sp.]
MAGLCLAVVLLAGCSPERNNFFSKAYQNTTARYNAYFLGNERLKTIEADVTAKAVTDYNRLLPIFPVIDSTIAAGFKKDLEEIIKKASYPIQKHATSDWTDDSYLLIGKARFYGLEYEEAIKTFKYVNSTSQNEVTRHEALVWLMRSFLQTEDLESAKAVSDIMKKQFLTKENALLLFLTRAQYYLLLKDDKLAIQNLKLAIPLIEKKDEEARIRFILGQLYQRNSEEKLARQQFNRILRKNPPYELGFQSKLYLGQVTEVSDASSKEAVDKYFRKLLRDAKNKEYLDKIYYEMARFQLKQNKPELALQYLTQSVKNSTVNTAQKGYSYLLAGQTYYDKLQKYNLAQAYYDSAVQVLPQTAAEYAAAAERRDVLNDFVGHYNIVTRQDSLLQLASLDKATLDARIDAIIKAAEEKKAADARRAAELAAKGANNNTGNNRNNIFGNNNNGTAEANIGTPTGPGGVWYFDNPATIGSAKAEFIRRWGNRPLQDNWRISNQQPTGSQQNLQAISPGALPGAAADTAATATNMRETLLQDIPLTPEMKLAANQKVETSLFTLGNIYRERLEEPAHAIETYEKFVARFPNSKNAPEAYYALYLLYKTANDPKQQTYAARIKQQFPNSRYAKLIDNPNYLAEVSADNAKVRELYDKAFALYDEQKFKEANEMLNNIRQASPDAELIDRVAFLNVLIVGKTEQPSLFKLALQNFVKTYPSSNLLPKAQQYLDAFALYESGKLSEAEFDRTHPNQPKPVVPVNAPVTPPLPTTQKPAALTNKKEVTPSDNKSQAAATTVPQNPVAVTPAPATKTPAANSTNNPAGATNTPTNNTPANNAPVNNTPANTPPAAPVTPVVPEPAKPKYAANLQVPQVVLIIYPKGHAAFAGIAEKMQSYNGKYNASDNLTVETTTFNATQDMVVIREFTNGAKAKTYTIKQKSPQSPLSKIRGIEFATFVISADNLPIFLKEGNLEEYLTFYKNNY